MFQINNKTIKITRGDTGIFTLNVMQQDGTPYDYSDDIVKMTVKQNTNTDTILIQKTIQYGENVVIEPLDTSKMKYGEYWYDVQITKRSGEVDTVIPPSKFIVMQEVTFNE